MPLNHFAEIRPFDILHRDERHLVRTVLPQVVDRDDRRVVENPRRLGFAHEALLELALLLEIGREAEPDRLEGPQPADDRVARKVDDSHRSLAELPHDLVPAQPLCAWVLVGHLRDYGGISRVAQMIYRARSPGVRLLTFDSTLTRDMIGAANLNPPSEESS